MSHNATSKSSKSNKLQTQLELEHENFGYIKYKNNTEVHS